MYTVYKITNKINSKTYVGVHKTENPNDYYMGSGKAIKAAIEKHGRENFEKEILLITEDKNKAYEYEKELTVDFTSNKNYNMKLGGIGGFTKENARKGLLAVCKLGGTAARDKKAGVHAFTKEQLAEAGRKGGLAHKGKPKSEEHKQKLREAMLRKKNMPL